MSTTETKIEWCDRTWNPVRGCSRISEGCRNCYAERVAARFSGKGRPFDGFARLHVSPLADGRMPKSGKARWTGKVELVPDALDEPLRWRKPARIFVNSMSDLFHEGLADEDIDHVFAVMALAPRHRFLVLTKRAERMRRYFEDPGLYDRWLHAAVTIRSARPETTMVAISDPARFPPRWVWLGVSVEDQATADARIPHLLATPAAVRFVSYEPALGPVNFERFLPEPLFLCQGCGRETRSDHCKRCGTYSNTCTNELRGIDWLIVGGESGPGARECRQSWLESAVAQCREARVPVFVKQMGANACDDVTWRGSTPDYRFRDRKGGDPSEWAEDLRVREFPASAA